MYSRFLALWTQAGGGGGGGGGGGLEDGGAGEEQGGDQGEPVPPVAPLPPPDVANVGEQRQQVEDAPGQVGPPDDARHRLGVDGVRREEQPGDGRPGPGRRQDVARQLHHQPGRQRVQQHVDQVVPERLEAVQQVVQLEAGHAQRPVGAVRARVGQRRAPEVVLQHLRPAAGAEHVRVAEDRPSERKRQVEREAQGSSRRNGGITSSNDNSEPLKPIQGLLAKSHQSGEGHGWGTVSGCSTSMLDGWEMEKKEERERASGRLVEVV
uniref:Uncharacterized protein n=1 Tax=Anopheles atroparvus TaxID=41427 RepID=A0A182IPS4_ANOAO